MRRFGLGHGWSEGSGPWAKLLLARPAKEHRHIRSKVLQSLPMTEIPLSLKDIESTVQYVQIQMNIQYKESNDSDLSSVCCLPDPG